jgi:preprotein translocase subunit SecA
MFDLDTVTKLLAKIFGSKGERDVKKLWPVVEQIKSWEEEIEALSDEELKQRTEKFKKQLREATAGIDKDIEEAKARINDKDEELSVDEHRDLAESLDELEDEWLEVIEEELDAILPEAFAVIKDTCRRFVGQKWMAGGSEIEWNMVPYDVQLVGAVALHRGSIAEMKTGEGKTLASIMPAYLNALTGRGVHIVTVNDYLAKRDAEWNAPIYNFHGLEVDCINNSEPNSEGRRKAYQADVTYGTNNEFGFDYLRDNMVAEAEELVQRGHHYAIVDEIDSILIDEARTPLIISGPVPQDTQSEKYGELQPRVASLVNAQKKLVASLTKKALKALKEDDDQEAGLALFRASRGFPKNRQFRKMMQTPENERLMQRTEAFYLQDNARRLPEADAELFYSVDEKMQSIEMTEKGRDFITRSNEEDDFFIIPDLGLETTNIEDEIEDLREQKIIDIEDEEEFSEEYKDKKIRAAKNEVTQERERRFSELHLMFAERSDRIHTVNQLLKAYTLFEREDEYIVQDGKVQIVDEHTGRVLSGRRYSDGLHQALEAKENVNVEATTQTYATITLQNFFRMYHKLSGMTGTAATEEGEFNEIYELDVMVIPTNEPVIRNDEEDLVFRSKREKYNAVIDKIKEYHEKGQPVLVGTTSVDVSEVISRMLKRQKIPHNVLNAKQHARESEIVATAGQPGSVTVATNMAGRGTDIKLARGVQEKGGLAILGTERHESRRIDLQLRGRSGRQGDPGESQFYVSLEDDLMQLFGSDRVAKVMERLNFEEGEVITHSWITKSLERAQEKVEQNNFSIRKKQLEYDDVLNNQRDVIYERRRHALSGDQLRGDVYDMLDDLVESIVDEHYNIGEFQEIKDAILRILAVDIELEPDDMRGMADIVLIDDIIEKSFESYRQKEAMISEPLYEVIKNIAESDAGEKPERVQVIFTDGMMRVPVVVDVDKAMENEGHEVARALERMAVLSTIDNKWMEHLRELDSVKEGIGLRSFAQKDPLLEYKREAFEMFQTLVQEINQETISMIWKSVPEIQVDEAPMEYSGEPQGGVDMNRAELQHADSTNMGFNQTAESVQMSQNGGGNGSGQRSDEKPRPVTVEKEPGRNDYVKIQQPGSGEIIDIKWKKAKRMINEDNWILIEH